MRRAKFEQSKSVAAKYCQGRRSPNKSQILKGFRPTERSGCTKNRGNALCGWRKREHFQICCQACAMILYRGEWIAFVDCNLLGLSGGSLVSGVVRKVEVVVSDVDASRNLDAEHRRFSAHCQSANPHLVSFWIAHVQGAYGKILGKTVQGRIIELDWRHPSVNLVQRLREDGDVASIVDNIWILDQVRTAKLAA